MNNFFFYLMHKRIKLFIIIIYCFLYLFSNLNLNSMRTHSKTTCVWHMLWWFVDKCCICIHKRITISIFRFFFFSAKTLKTWPKNECLTNHLWHVFIQYFIKHQLRPFLTLTDTV